MNREILFRGKRLDNGEWFFGSLLVEGSLLIGGDGREIVVPKKGVVGCFVDMYPIDPKTVGQYTGLKDKNGVRIFEGDFTRHHRYEDIAYLVWHEQHICFAGKSLDENGGERYYYQKRNEPYLEVIGNIHDNPELLEVKEGG